MIKFAFSRNMHTNALNPTAFPSLLLYETEVVSMCADLLHGDGQVAGSMTSGGTESVLMAFKACVAAARITVILCNTFAAGTGTWRAKTSPG